MISCAFPACSLLRVLRNWSFRIDLQFILSKLLGLSYGLLVQVGVNKLAVCVLLLVYHVELLGIVWLFLVLLLLEANGLGLG